MPVQNLQLLRCLFELGRDTEVPCPYRRAVFLSPSAVFHPLENSYTYPTVSCQLF